MPTNPERARDDESSIDTQRPDPWSIATLRLIGGGQLGLAACPGRRPAPRKTCAALPDVERDLDAVAAWGAAVVITVMETDELEALGVAGLGNAVTRRSMAWLQVPIPERGVPDAADEARWTEISRALDLRLTDGAKVLIHSNGGLGRAGLVAALIAIDRDPFPEVRRAGDNPLDALAAEAIAQVRAADEGAFDGAAHQQWLQAYAQRSGMSRLTRGMEQSDLYRRVLGFLLGGACGDALGAPVELLRHDRDFTPFGPRGVREFAAGPAPIGAITDDTQLTLFTAEGMLRGWICRRLQGSQRWPPHAHNGILRWYFTQTHAWPMQPGPDGYLIQIEALHQVRGPGKTCLSALAQTTALGQLAQNDSKGCGGVMRVAPVGVYCEDAEAFDVGAECAQHTHGHPSGYLSAGWLACCVSGLLRGQRLVAAAAIADRRLAERPEVNAGGARALKTPRALANARAEAERTVEGGLWPSRIPASLGQGWVGEEALAIAFYCALLAEAWCERGDATVDVVEDAMSLAVTHVGDSDSTGSITGQLLGARFGATAIPPRWTEAVELRDVIAQLAWWLVGSATERLPAAALRSTHPGW